MCDVGDHVLAYACTHEVGQAAQMVQLLFTLEPCEADHHTNHDPRVDGTHTVWELKLQRKK